jgi:EAL domain-containing protein (putative c-di-GMP-specific phosphodiesterase class I)
VRLAERVSAGLTTPFAVGGQEIVVSASIGIALSGPRTRRADSLLFDADAAMQRAKQRGGGIYELFDEAVRAQLIERLELERALRRAVDADELRVLYQPIVSLKEGRLVGVEALARWEQPGRGLLLPAEFVPFAEETGLIVPVGAWVLEEACRQAARWRAAGGRPLPPTMHVNLSPRQFGEPHLVDLVAGALADTGTDPDRLCLEVTERALAANPASAATTLKRLSALGVRVSVDDFGTGYSSLASLQYLPISSLKIDRSFVARLDLDPEDDAMVAAVIGLAHTLGLAVIAEGVETPASSPSWTSSAATTPRATCSLVPRRPAGSASSSVRTRAGSDALPQNDGTDPAVPVYRCARPSPWRADHWTTRSSSSRHEGAMRVPTRRWCAGTRTSPSGRPT